MGKKQGFCFYSFDFRTNRGLITGPDRRSVERAAADLDAGTGEFLPADEGVTLELRFLPHDKKTD